MCNPDVQLQKFSRNNTLVYGLLLNNRISNGIDDMLQGAVNLKYMYIHFLETFRNMIQSQLVKRWHVT